MVFKKGDPGTDFFLVHQGTALVEDGGKVGGRGARADLPAL